MIYHFFKIIYYLYGFTKPKMREPSFYSLILLKGSIAMCYQITAFYQEALDCSKENIFCVTICPDFS